MAVKKVTKKGAAGKRPAVAAKAKRLPAADSGEGSVTLEQFRVAVKEYLHADENLKLYAKRRDAQKPVVRSYVDEHAVDLDKGKSRGLVDNAIKWLLVPGAAKVDDEAGVAAILAAVAKATGDRKRVLEACLKQTVDREAFEKAKTLGFIDDELAGAYEKGRSYALKWEHTDQIACHECRAVATRNAKFCAQCGADLTQQTEWQG